MHIKSSVLTVIAEKVWRAAITAFHIFTAKVTVLRSVNALKTATSR